MVMSRADWRRLRVDVVVNGVAASPVLPRPIRARLLRVAGMDVAHGVLLHARCWFGGTSVSFGAGTWVNYGAWFDNSAPIHIGQNVSIGQQVMFCTSSHEFGPHARRAGAGTSAPINVGDGCWIGSRAVILPGVTIGAGAVVGAGSVVRSDCVEDGVYAGVPARLIRTLER